MLKAVLVILTLAPGGATHLALSPADDAADCEAKRDVVTQILENAGAKVTAAACGQTDLSFTPYIHGAPEAAFVHRWRVMLGKSGPVITQLAPNEGCAEAREARPPVLCAVSPQSVLD